MARGIDSNLNTALTGDTIRLFFAMKAEFAGGTARFWSGIGDKTIESETYIGAGDIVAFAPIEHPSKRFVFNISFLYLIY